MGGEGGTGGSEGAGESRLAVENADLRKRLKAEEENRDEWQDKAEKTEAKLKVLVGMIDGMVDIIQAGGSLEQIGEIMMQAGDAIEVADTDATIEVRCACWYRARLAEMKRQLGIAIEEARKDPNVEVVADIIEKVAAPFGEPMRDLDRTIRSLESVNHLSLLGVIEGGSIARLEAQSSAQEAVDETGQQG